MQNNNNIIIWLSITTNAHHNITYQKACFYANNLPNIVKLCMGNPIIANKLVRFPVEPQDSYRCRKYCDCVLLSCTMS